MATSANVAVAALQAAVNRFSGVGNFDAVVVDGGMGGETENATQNALFAASQAGTGAGIGAATVIPGLLADLNANIGAGEVGAGQTYIMQNVSAITSALSSAANAMGLPVEIKPSVITTVTHTVKNLIGGSSTAPTGPGGPKAASSLDQFFSKLGMTSTQGFIFLGLVGGVGYFALRKANKRKR